MLLALWLIAACPCLCLYIQDVLFLFSFLASLIQMKLLHLIKSHLFVYIYIYIHIHTHTHMRTLTVCHYNRSSVIKWFDIHNVTSVGTNPRLHTLACVTDWCQSPTRCIGSILLYDSKPHLPVCLVSHLTNTWQASIEENRFCVLQY